VSKRRTVGEWHQRAVATRRHRSEEKILEAAAALVQEHGYDTTVEMIAEQAGVGVATVYNRFDSKAGLYASVFDRLQPIPTAEVPGDLLTSELVERRLRSLATTLSRHRALALGLQKALSEGPVERLDSLAGPLTAAIEQGQARGDIRSDLEAGEVASLAVTMLLVRVLARNEAPAMSASRVASLLLWGVAGNPQPIARAT